MSYVRVDRGDRQRYGTAIKPRMATERPPIPSLASRAETRGQCRRAKSREAKRPNYRFKFVPELMARELGPAPSLLS